MANRTIQQKVQKMKRMRRAHLKSFSMRSAGPTNLEGIGFGARSQVAQTSFDSWFLRRKQFNINSNEVIYARTRGLHTDIWPGGTEVVLAKMQQSRNGAGSLQSERRYVYSIVRKEPNSELRLYISGDDCFFVYEATTRYERVYKVSHEYSKKQRALDANKYGRIAWVLVEREPLQFPPHIG